MLSSLNKTLASPRLFSSSSGICFFDIVTNKKHHFATNKNGNKESRFGLRSGSELRPGKKEMDEPREENRGNSERNGGEAEGVAEEELWWSSAMAEGRKQEGKEEEWR
ncbi:hypothetical protein F3Y22_tig00112637pilonHSYRG00018 [Hibiscus syriacus]|uniref:Uncharacterized protein n=1 Tax=Hibiscus syriacus TaxID=106335 RepID=A0A6A2XD93_HIBSY|nr:hypothetical protein F3Y22_tig00112637pilonHSYRG00018 [Hibiscus syriacus]